MKIIITTTICLLCLFVVHACKSQVSKDNPVLPNNVAKFPKKNSDFLGKNRIKVLQEATIVQAYHLKEFSKDTTAMGFEGYKVIKRIPKLAVEDVDSLMKLLKDSTIYTFKNSPKKCEFGPDLAFKFIKGDSSTIIFFALNCDMVSFKHNKQSAMTDFDAGHNKILKYAKSIFPANYRNMAFKPAEQLVPIPTQIVDTTTTTVATRGEVEENIIKHKVAKKENIKSLAKKYKVSEKDILTWNDMEKPTPLEEGMEIIIKTKNEKIKEKSKEVSEEIKKAKETKEKTDKKLKDKTKEMSEEGEVLPKDKKSKKTNETNK